MSFSRYLERLLQGLGADERVLGVIALGSTAMVPERPPDEWSDHDVWVVVGDGAEEAFRAEPFWLPDHERLVLWMRETAHGMKALYDDGHLVEVAVFRPDELVVTRANDYRVLLDRERIGERMAAVRGATIRGVEPRGPAFLAGQFLTSLLVGGARHARGERLSGHDFVKAQAVGHLLALANVVLSPARDGAVDDLTPWRRVERSHPVLAAEIDAALLLDTGAASLALLDIAERYVGGDAAWPEAAARVVTGMLNRWNGRIGDPAE
jgi:predicted nucleotidyltransferase